MKSDPSEWSLHQWDEYHRREKIQSKGDPSEWSSRVWENPLPRMTKQEYEILNRNKK